MEFPWSKQKEKQLFYYHVIAHFGGIPAGHGGRATAVKVPCVVVISFYCLRSIFCQILCFPKGLGIENSRNGLKMALPRISYERNFSNFWKCSGSPGTIFHVINEVKHFELNQFSDGSNLLGSGKCCRRKVGNLGFPFEVPVPHGQVHCAFGSS